MLKKIKMMRGRDIAILTTFVNINVEEIMAGKIKENPDDYKYKNLIMDTHIPENENILFNVSDVIDNLMFDNYTTYLQMKDRVSTFSASDMEDLDLDKRSMKMLDEAEEMMRDFIKLYKKLMLETKFDYPHIRQIQKYILEKELQRQISFENYEICAEIKINIEKN